ncbi:MAG: AGE family epimerase/isomerase [Bacteroidota bacterium]
MLTKTIAPEKQQAFSKEMEAELVNILQYWTNHAVDEEHGGFFGKIDNNNTVHKRAPKNAILSSRLLWTFAKACNFYEDRSYDGPCLRAFEYLYDNFKDPYYGGLYWEVDFEGQPVDKRKQVYAQAFAIYALSEYYKYSKNPDAAVWANNLFDLIETYSRDQKTGGYWEAFNEKWGPSEDMRLSEKDLNAPKTANTHLHILEAYTTYYEVNRSKRVRDAIQYLIELFLKEFFDGNNHLKLFFSKDWKSLSHEISYGHDIEAAWLLLVAARTIEDDDLIESTEECLKEVAKTFINEALDKDFGVINAKDAETNKTDPDRHWWAQAEAIVGLLYNWTITNDSNYFRISEQIWAFIATFIIDRKNGEWFFRVDRAGTPYGSENKIGPWKCPYHNTRALMEAIDLLKHG